MTLHELNILSQPQLKEALLKCCGSASWVKMMMAYFPADDLVELLEDAEEKWYDCSEDDWREAFAQHPKIGDIDALSEKFASTADWASGEQSGINNVSRETMAALAEGNRLYEEKFGYIFIVCATGKSAEEMLALLQSRLSNTPEVEIKIAADQQNEITKLRLQKLLE
ncbi:MAG: 2-oxo-4-hydroxy-4-carboxy-5-ureidoimidazoline decarboxylase [Chitinophagaceae bacterium]|nr:2-oxo-4-hydroxy-4-carboxy-5-ureidoimidazoline decarboxylase [Chitinophagaceae bacterium]MBL0274053.1 2-oxo-4-hydroxy-4-carboxy-5-ureidoimidazoline decarboxylase [Chitinophagaceae bacterium]